MTTRYYLMGVLLLAASIAKAQDTYLNDRLTATDDVNGSARYVGMGGAMGALGADLSAISSNPAGMALYRKNDIGLTFGAVIPNKANGWNSSQGRTYDDKLPKASFDQAGIVWCLNTGGDKLRYANFGFNYQKKANYNMGFYADNPNLNGLSQMDLLAELAQSEYNTNYNLAGKAVDNKYLSKNDDGKYVNAFIDDAGNQYHYNGENSYYTRHQWGSLQSFDLNFSFNLKDRFYTGMTLGIDNVDYESWSGYEELNSDCNGNLGDYTLYNDRVIDGVGVNVKLGFIVRPIAENPLRLGLAVETPTWYRMKSSTLFDLTDHIDGTRTSADPETYLEYSVRTPWRVRLSAGSTVDKFLAWGVEYEFANAAKTSMGYPDYPDDGYHSTFASTKDKAMNELTKDVLRGQHTIKAGIEVKPIDAVAIRVGYNFVSSRYKDNPTFDQYSLDSKAMDYSTATDYMTFGPTNIVTFGVGYQYKKFYANMAYKYRVQNAKFYAFDTSFTTTTQFADDNPDLVGATIDPVDVDLHRHQLMFSVGFKF